jgi:hypothetical protein
VANPNLTDPVLTIAKNLLSMEGKEIVILLFVSESYGTWRSGPPASATK